MPLPITFDWSEDEQMLYFVLHVKGATTKNVDIALCDVYVKVNCHPSLFEVDLVHEIDPEDPKTKCRVGSGKVLLNLKKKDVGLWQEFRAKGTKQELRARRKQSLEDAAVREEERRQQKEDWKQDMIKKGEHEQWRLDAEQREKIEKWENEERQKWEEAMYAAFDEETQIVKDADALPILEGDLDAPDEVEGVSSSPVPAEKKIAKVEINEEKICEVTDEEAAAIREAKAEPPVVKKDNGAIWTDKDFEDTEEYVPEIREKNLKVGMPFSVRPRVGVPVRDRGQTREPPHPKNMVKSDMPPMMIGDHQEDENDPVWLKDKADNLMVAGDYQGAYNAYTEALKLATNSRAFANRAVASLYMGNFEQCIEDCNHAVRILDLRNKTPAGAMPHPEDPQDALVRVRVHVRIATAYLWLGAFGKAEDHLGKALEAEDGLEYEDRKIVKEDLGRVKAARVAFLLKEKADTAMRHAAGGGDREKSALETALGYYDDAAILSGDTAGVHANRCFARLRAGQLESCLEDGAATISYLKRWPVAMKPPKRPARPARLDPPYLDDPTFKHPDEQKQGEVDWLMKHGGGTKDNLPPIPPEYEWHKDATDKTGDTWIALRKKMTKAAIDTVKRNTMALQDAVYTRNHRIIQEQIPHSLDTNRVGEGPSNIAIKQAEKYAEKLEAYDKEREKERENDAVLLRQEAEEADLEQALAPARGGQSAMGFGRGHPVEKTRRRLLVKTLLRQARAHELLGDAEAGVEQLRMALRIEPDNPEANARLNILAHPPSVQPAEEKPAKPDKPLWPATSSMASAKAAFANETSAGAIGVANGAPRVKAESKANGKKEVDGLLDDEEEPEQDHASTAALVSSAAEYMKRSDYSSALQIYGYARIRCKHWENPLVELKVLSNTCLCLQRLRGQLPELVQACGEVISRIEELRAEENFGGLSEETLLQMESASLSRRGSALAQLKRTVESAKDAARVKELMARIRDIEYERAEAMES